MAKEPKRRPPKLTSGTTRRHLVIPNYVDREVYVVMGKYGMTYSAAIRECWAQAKAAQVPLFRGD